MKVLKVKQNDPFKRKAYKKYRYIIEVEENNELTLEQEAKIRIFFESLK